MLEERPPPGGRTPPVPVVASTPDEAVDRGRTARGRPPPQHERPVDEDAIESEAVDVGRLTLVQDAPVAKVVEPPPELGCALGIQPAEEVPRAVRLVRRHQR